MSIGEVAVALIIAILICKPEDIKFIVKEFYKLKSYLSEIRMEVCKPFTGELIDLKTEVQDLVAVQSLEEINFYLHKIASLNESYQGEYSLSAIKQYYYQLIKNRNE